MTEEVQSVGIDLGTTNSEIYTYVNKHSRAIPAPNGSTITESRIGVDPKSVDTPIIVTGAKMRNLRNRAPENVVYEPKRIIGRLFDDQYVKRDLHFWPFCIEKGDDGYPLYKFVGQKGPITMSAIEVDAEILKLLKSYVHGGVTKAVITVPSYFTREQTDATKRAGELAGFEVLRCLPEPVAAAIAYGHASGAKNETVVVYDLGGGTFDCCIVVIENGKYSILHSDGHSHLGGADFDNAIVRLMATELKEKHGVDVYESRKDLSKLKDLAEKAKIALSDADSYNLKHTIVNPVTMVKVEYEHMLTRVEFESLIKGYIDNTIEYIRRALESSGLKPQNISRVIPIGGSTRIPYVKQRLGEFFGRDIETLVNIDEGVAEGAAIDADALCHGVDLLQGLHPVIPHLTTDIEQEPLANCPHDIFFNVGDGFNRTFVKGTNWGQLRDGTTGIRVNRRIVLGRNYMKKVRMNIYKRRDENGAMELIHCIELDIEEPRPGRECEIAITMIYRSRGELTVVMTDVRSGAKESDTFTCRGDDSDNSMELTKLKTLRDMEAKAKMIMEELLKKGNDEVFVELRRDVIEKMTWLEDCGEYCDDDELEEQKDSMNTLVDRLKDPYNTVDESLKA